MQSSSEFTEQQMHSELPNSRPLGNRILLVDDEEIIRVTLGHIFEAEGYEVRRAHSAEEALERLADWTPDLALVDVNLLKINGIELARRILARNPDCRVLLFSGRPETADMVLHATKEGDKFQLAAKPIHPKHLLEWARKGRLSTDAGSL